MCRDLHVNSLFTMQAQHTHPAVVSESVCNMAVGIIMQNCSTVWLNQLMSAIVPVCSCFWRSGWHGIKKIEVSLNLIKKSPIPFSKFPGVFRHCFRILKKPELASEIDSAALGQLLPGDLLGSLEEQYLTTQEVT